ncbi:hypothetical protein, variant [Aphanomyces astaci]|uniref:CRAL-TRIO domain-containing protein n=1 Tax=Aphanomyces astaci TaxID=112090 RepID=W4G224_APHAT|nr:hypothetical protein, variant [Aphanomyces astaci]ETV73336.1 hypothetical protein, variant [Aphanomyces astaci]|eukprot:XP_009837210.1 hypothetical protein, variant [Aphanomyces astaci]
MSQNGTDVALAGLFKRRGRQRKPTLKQSVSMASALRPVPANTATPTLHHHRSEGDIPTQLMGSDLPGNPAPSTSAAASRRLVDPHVTDLDVMPHPVKFGDVICLWSVITDPPPPPPTSSSNTSSSQNTCTPSFAHNATSQNLGVVGLFDVDAVRPNNLTLHKCGALVCVALPSEPHFTPSYFRVLPECYYAHLKLGSPVSYGDVVVLVDVCDKVWNNKIGFEFNGHFAPTEKLNRPGEMTIAFVKPTTASQMDPDGSAHSPEDLLHESTAGMYYGEPAKPPHQQQTPDQYQPTGTTASTSQVLCFGDTNVLVQVVDSNRLRLGFNQILTRFRKKSTPIVHGAYLRCDGRGTTLRVSIHPPPPPAIQSMWVVSDPTPSNPHDTRTAVDVPEHTDMAGVVVTVTGSMRYSRLHMALGESFGSLELPLSTLHAKAGHDPWTVDVVSLSNATPRPHPRRRRRPIRLDVQTTATSVVAHKTSSLSHAVAESQSRMMLLQQGVVLGLVGLYVVAVITGEIAASNMYGMVLLWVKPVLPLAWIASSWWFHAKQQPTQNEADQTDDVTVQLTIVSWSVVASPGSACVTDQTEMGDGDLPQDMTLPPLSQVLTLDDDNGEGVVVVPRSFVVAEMGNLAKARTRYHETLAWRKEQRMDDVLTTPQVHYHTIRRFYKQCIHKQDKQGHPVYIEKLGGIDLKGLLAHGVTLSDLFGHYLFNVEYIFNRVATTACPCASCKDSHTQKLCIVLDARGLGMRDLAGDVLEFVRGCTSVMQKHYPQRSLKIFVVNVPSWFGMIWKLIQPLLNETTRAKTSILSEADVPAALLACIDAADLPIEYGGTCQCDGGGCFAASAVQLAQQRHVDFYMRPDTNAAADISSNNTSHLVDGNGRHDDEAVAPAVSGGSTTRMASIAPHQTTMFGLVKKKSSGEVCALDTGDSDDSDDNDLEQMVSEPPSILDDVHLQHHHDDIHHPPIPSRLKARLYKKDKVVAAVLHSGHLLMRLIRQKHFVNPIWLRRFITLSRTCDIVCIHI